MAGDSPHRKEDGTIRDSADDSMDEAIRDAQRELIRLREADCKMDMRPIELFAESLAETEAAGVLPIRVSVFKDMWTVFNLQRSI